jgi:hypothetical protein
VRSDGREDAWRRTRLDQQVRGQLLRGASWPRRARVGAGAPVRPTREAQTSGMGVQGTEVERARAWRARSLNGGRERAGLSRNFNRRVTAYDMKCAPAPPGISRKSRISGWRRGEQLLDGYAFVSVEEALFRFNRSLDVAHTPARRAHLQQTRTREAEEANWALLERGWAMITCRRRTLREGCHPGPRRMRPDQPAPMPPRAPQPPPCRAPCGLARSGCWLVRVFAPRYDHSKHCRG